MKIEMDDNTTSCVIATDIALVIIFLAFLVYHYNAIVYEKGYTEVQLDRSQQTMWVTPK